MPMLSRNGSKRPPRPTDDLEMGATVLSQQTGAHERQQLFDDLQRAVEARRAAEELQPMQARRSFTSRHSTKSVTGDFVTYAPGSLPSLAQPDKNRNVSNATPAGGEVQAHGLIQQRISSLEKYSLEATVTSNTHDARIEMLESTVRTLANEVQVASAAIITLSENVPGGAQPPRPPLSTGADAEDIKIQLSAMQEQIAALQQAARQQEEQIEFLQRSMSELLDGKMAAQHPFVECSQAEETKKGEEENREEEEGEDNTIEGNKITAQGSSGVHFNEKPFKTIGRTAKTPKSGLGKGLTRKKLDPVVPETAEKGHQNFLKNTETTSSPDENTQEAAVTSGPVIIIPHEKCPKIGHKAHHAKKRLRKKTLEHTDSRGGSRTYLCPKREHVYEEHHDDDADHRVWVHCSENAYGSFLYLCLHDNVKSACTQSGPMLVVSWLLQCCFSWELWQALPSVNESAAFCLVPMSIQASAIMVFITLMMNNVAPMTVHATLALNTSHMRFEDDHNRVELIVLKTWQRVFGVTVVFLSEAVTWMGVIAVGIQFILVSQSVEMVMRSTVSIVFILNIDEVIFHACGSQKLKNSLAKTSFQMNDRRTKVLGVSFEKFQDFRTNMSGYWYLPFLIILSTVMVTLYRIREDCASSQNGFYGQQTSWSEILDKAKPEAFD